MDIQIKSSRAILATDSAVKSRVDLSIDDLSILKQALETMTIRGKDAMFVGKLLVKITTSFDKELAKESK